jgi:hypothetical protein
MKTAYKVLFVSALISLSYLGGVIHGNIIGKNKGKQQTIEQIDNIAQSYSDKIRYWNLDSQGIHTFEYMKNNAYDISDILKGKNLNKVAFEQLNRDYLTDRLN